ncbi:MAG: c-type cytochrome [Nitrospinae bacterium]|nr:c-type cytochrome [Nitrospinota bacterium]
MKKFLIFTALILVGGMAFVVPYASADAAKGEALFNDKGKSKCLACHAIGKKVVGPDLAGVSKRHTQPWLVKWITDAQGTWASADSETTELKARVHKEKAPKPAHAPPPLTAEQAGDLADFLMTK